MTDGERDGFVLFALFVSFPETLLYELVSVELMVPGPSGRTERFVEASIDPGLVLPRHCFRSDPVAVFLFLFSLSVCFPAARHITRQVARMPRWKSKTC